MNITRADKKNIQKGTAAAKKRKKKFIKVCIIFFLQNLCVGVAASNNTVYIHVPGSVRCNVVYLPTLPYPYVTDLASIHPSIHLSIHPSRAAIFSFCQFFFSLLSSINLCTGLILS